MKAPGWGKAIGIIMIILGSFGIFYQAYKIIIPKVIDMQERMFNGISESTNNWEDFNDDGNLKIKPDKLYNSVMDEFMISQSTRKILPLLGIIGILFNILYIVGGAMLLRPKAISYKMAIGALGAMIGLNVISATYLLSTDSSFILFGLMIYTFIGTAIDIALLIISLASDKTAYGYTKFQDAEKLEEFDV